MSVRQPAIGALLSSILRTFANTIGYLIGISVLQAQLPCLPGHVGQPFERDFITRAYANFEECSSRELPSILRTTLLLPSPALLVRKIE